jgi:hypothetical protein
MVSCGVEALPPMLSAVGSVLLLGGLVVALALTVAWDGFIGHEFFRFFELVL